jgi:LexA-binding, inner membrane-associated putative hydrolase
VSPVTHFLSGWVLAATTHINRRNRALVTMSAVVPDIDGLGALPEHLTRNTSHPLFWFSQYHHSLHTLAFAVAVCLLAAAIARQARWKTALLCFIGFHLHLLGDLLGSRGPDGDQWPIPYLAPFSSAQFEWSGQWMLNAWPNFAITIALVISTLYLARLKGYSPVEMISRDADSALVRVLRQRFPFSKSAA